MYNLLWKKVSLLLTIIFISYSSLAQKEQWRMEHDDLDYYFGATLGSNIAYLSATKSDKFLRDDSILVAEPSAIGGLSIGMHVTARLAKHWQVRFNPQIILGGARSFTYTLGTKSITENSSQAFTLPTTLVSFPLSFKFNSDRINNFRTYLLLGAKMDIDLTASSSSRSQENYIKLKKNQYGVEFGIGFNFFMQWVSISPELKISYGLNDIHDRNPNLKYSSVFSEIKPRMIMFSLHFEH
jgi:hypothetical protein